MPRVGQLVRGRHLISTGTPKPYSRTARSMFLPARDTQLLGNGDHSPTLWKISLWSLPIWVPLSLGICWNLNDPEPGNDVGWGCTYRSKKGTGTQEPSQMSMEKVPAHTRSRRWGCAARPPRGQCGDGEEGLWQLHLQPPLQRSAPAGPGVIRSVRM